MKPGYLILLSNFTAFACFGLGYATGKQAKQDGYYVSRAEAASLDHAEKVVLEKDARNHKQAMELRDWANRLSKRATELDTKWKAMQAVAARQIDDMPDPPIPGETEEFPAPPPEYRPKQKDLYVRTFDRFTFWDWCERKVRSGDWPIPDTHELRDGKIFSVESGQENTAPAVWAAKEIKKCIPAYDGEPSYFLPLEVWQEWVVTDPRAAIPRPPVAPADRDAGEAIIGYSH